MVLNGTIHEFILADILQLLSQQKTTGKLVFTAGTRNGFLILSEGAIIAAEDDCESLPQKLRILLTTVKRVPEQIIKTLIIASTGQDISAGVNELVNRQFLSPAEVIAIAQASIEDFVCSLCAWKNGEYRFESLPSVAHYAVPTVSLSADYIVMEAMRRNDESKSTRMQLTDETIFVHTVDTTLEYAADATGILTNPDPYAYMFVDGITTIAMLSQRVCLSRYRLFEILHRLWGQDQITPLSNKLSRSIQAALGRKEDGKGFSPGILLRTVGLTVAAISVMLVTGLLIHELPQKSRAASPEEKRHVITQEQCYRKSRAAMLEYWLKFGTRPSTIQDLIQTGILSKADAADVPLSLLKE